MAEQYKFGENVGFFPNSFYEEPVEITINESGEMWQVVHLKSQEGQWSKVECLNQGWSVPFNKHTQGNGNVYNIAKFLEDQEGNIPRNISQTERSPKQNKKTSQHAKGNNEYKNKCASKTQPIVHPLCKDLLTLCLPDQALPVSRESKIEHVQSNNLGNNHDRSLSVPVMRCESIEEHLIHVLAIRPFKYLELKERLIREGFHESIDCLLSQISIMKDSKLELIPSKWCEVRLDWPFYSKLERLMTELRKEHQSPQSITNATKTIPSTPHLYSHTYQSIHSRNVVPANNYTSRESNNQYNARHEVKGSEKPSCDSKSAALCIKPNLAPSLPSYNRPGFQEGPDGFQYKRRRISHVKSADVPVVKYFREATIKEPANTNNAHDFSREKQRLVFKKDITNKKSSRLTGTDISQCFDKEIKQSKKKQSKKRDKKSQPVPSTLDEETFKSSPDSGRDTLSDE